MQSSRSTGVSRPGIVPARLVAHPLFDLSGRVALVSAVAVSECVEPVAVVVVDAVTQAGRHPPEMSLWPEFSSKALGQVGRHIHDGSAT